MKEGYKLHIGVIKPEYLPLFIITSLLGSFVLANFAKVLENSRLLAYWGQYSLVILCTHILIKDVISIFMRLVFRLPEGWIHQVSNINGVCLTLAVLLMSIPATEFILYFCPVLIGKRKGVERKEK